MKYGLPLLGAAAATALFTFSTANYSAFAVEKPSNAQTFQQLGLFADVLARIRKDYVVEVDDSELIDEALNGMLHSLDPHSSYMNPDDFRDMTSTTRGEYGGLGMEVTIEDGVVTVITPMDDTPAERAGIQAGDSIVEIDGESILGLSLTEAVEKMRGAAGEPIVITVIREGADEPIEVSMVREVIKRKVVRYEVKDGVGYVRISSFNENTGEELENAVKELKKEIGGKLPGLVVDLRSNPGGLLDQSVRVSGVFLDGGEVVSTRSRDPRDTARYNAKRGDMLKNVPVVVLINGASASAAEIVAGALQDRERAVVVGMTTFGKGSVQSVIPLAGGRDGALRLTTARYYTPSGRSIQGLGVDPDIAVSYVKDDGKKRLNISESDLPNTLEVERMNDEGELVEKEIIIDYPPEDFEIDDDYQLKRAIEIVKRDDFNSLIGSGAR
ncbi:S41 family peptidase [Robiginitomaculum antarcticum]|uniref:S41 family peptidase n=1 Tax=Robiginitomaculum antarcticum TaxID=437507 RepID=UPI000372139D|nr:S41 family peptidase [Robiginitomaculum antarcticum]